MGADRSKKFDSADEIVEFPGITEQIVDIGDMTVARIVQQPGWRWSKDMRSVVEGEWCEAHHVGVNLAGRQGFLLRDGSTFEVGPGEVYDVPPGHDGFTVGDEPVVAVEWSGARTFGGVRTRAHSRVLTTLGLTDVVGSTELLSRLGDAAWRDLLSRHYESARSLLDRFGGREIATTGDGMLATFAAPATAIHCIADLQQVAAKEGLGLRAAVHVGEVEAVADELRGLAVHETARIVSYAAEGEILVSETAKLFAETAGLQFDDRGSHELKGFPTPRRLFPTPEREQVDPALVHGPQPKFGLLEARCRASWLVPEDFREDRSACRRVGTNSITRLISSLKTAQKSASLRSLKLLAPWR